MWLLTTNVTVNIVSRQGETSLLRRSDHSLCQHRHIGSEHDVSGERDGR
jgi:uncharacterized protein GlcG (DUF336 family)